MPVSEHDPAHGDEPFDAFVRRVTDPWYSGLILARHERVVEERDTAIALLQEAMHEGVLPPSFKERAWRFLANPMRGHHAG